MNDDTLRAVAPQAAPDKPGAPAVNVWYEVAKEIRAARERAKQQAQEVNG